MRKYNSLHIAGINYESMVDGVGVRTAIFLSGCSHHCPGCQNQKTWDPEYGFPCTKELVGEIAREIIRRVDFLSGITLTGGDPFYVPHNTLNFLYLLSEAVYDEAKKRDVKEDKLEKLYRDLWIYTGYTFEELIDRVNNRVWPVLAILANTSVLVDGRFKSDLRDVSLPFRGSSNQRIIDVQKSFDSRTLVLWGEQ